MDVELTERVLTVNNDEALNRFLEDNDVAVGEINDFYPPSKFLLVKNNITEEFLENVRKFIIHPDGFNLPTPKFLISVTGISKQAALDVIDCEIIDAFKSTLMKVAANTNALITSGSINVGVMREVGNAVKEDLNGGNKNVLGIASWRRVRFSNKAQFLDELRKKKPGINEDFFIEHKAEETKPLNPNHNFFIFVDNHHTGLQRGEIAFRSAFENRLVSDRGIPIILIVLSGGIGTLETIRDTVKNQYPVLLIDKTCGTTQLMQEIKDEIANSQAPLTEETISEIIDSNLQNPKFKSLFKTSNDKIENARAYLKDIFSNKKSHDCINVFKFTGAKIEIEEVILDALSKAKSSDRYYQITLAIRWSRFDKVQEIFNTTSFSEEEFNKLFTLALLQNKPEFIQFFLKKRFDLSKFLNVGRLRVLYNNDEKNSKRPHHEPFYHYLEKQKRNVITFSDIKNFLKKNFDTLDFDSFLPSDTEPDDAPMKMIEFNLFLWCILSNRLATSHVFWSLGNNQLCSALIAVKILKFFGNEISDNKLAFKNSANEFERLAIKTLDVFVEHTRDVVNDVLVIRYIGLVRMDCLQLAVESKSRNFVAHRVPQKALKTIWNGGEKFDENCDGFSRHEKHLKKCQKYSYNTTKHYIFKNEKIAVNKPNAVLRFLCIPRIKFYFHLISYLCFVLLFSQTMLIKYKTTSKFRNQTDVNYNQTLSSKPKSFWYSSRETILFFWMLTFLFDEIRQLFLRNYAKKSFLVNLKQYFTQDWNKLDVIGCLLFSIGYFLRIFHSNEDYGQLFLSMDLVIWYIRSLEFCLVFRKLGPKLLMIRRMVNDLLLFLVIIATFLFAFGVGLQSIVKQHDDYEFGILLEIFDKAYWPLFGDVRMLDSDSTQGASLKTTTVYLLLMIYMIIASVLLMNLLIAVFSGTFEKIQNNSDIIWKNQRYEFISQCVDASFLPPPFNIFVFIRYVLLCRNRSKENETFEDGVNVIVELERNCAIAALKEIKETFDSNEEFVEIIIARGTDLK